MTAPTPLPVRRRCLPRLPGRVPAAIVIAGTAAVGAVAWLALASPLTAVTSVDVSGVSPRWAGQVRAAAAGEVGRHAALVDTAAVAARIRAVPGVLSATVGIRWPHTLAVRVIERSAAAGVRLASGVRLYDAAGVDLGVAATPPQGLMLLDVPPSGLRPAVVLAALQVRRDLPPGLAAEVAAMGATSPDAVWLRLRDGTRVTWGSDEAPQAKAAALATLRGTLPPGRPAMVDVSAPGAPAVTG
ncbi:MAG: cell division protein FtsQ/DivIB [Kineosporiaceae bacterium]